MPMFNRSYDIYSTPIFTDVWSKYEDFKNDFLTCGIPAKITEENASTLYYLLYAQYGNTPIAFTDIGQFKYAVMSIIFRYGPTWEKRLEIQDKIRAFTEDDLRAGSRQIYNHANNPSTPVKTSVSVIGGTPILKEEGTLTEKEIGFVKEQDVALNSRGKLEAYTALYELLRTDVTSEFIKKFNQLFLLNVSKQRVPVYITDTEEDL